MFFKLLYSDSELYYYSVSFSSPFIISSPEEMLSPKSAGSAAITDCQKETESLRSPARWLMVTMVL